MKDLQQKINLAKDQTNRTVVMDVKDYVGIKSKLQDNQINYTILPENWQSYADKQMPWIKTELIFHSNADLDKFNEQCSGLYTPMKITLA